MATNILSRKMLGIAGLLLKKYPILTITGPRQSGKSTFAKMLRPGYEYINLEDIDHRRFAKNDPKGFIERYNRNIILDEVQNAPQILSQLQVHADATGRNGSYILTGSQNFQLFEKISQSLAGRTALCTLLPFSLEELSEYKMPVKWEEICWKGMYPRLHHQKIKPELFYPDYISTYVERDTRQIMNIKDLALFRRFMSLCAGRTGQMLNMNDFSNSLGVDNKTVRQWLGVLESSYIVYLLPPFHKNFNKRILKTPKLYFYDTGIASFLLGIRSVNDLKNHFARGALYENFIINELMKNCYNRRVQPEFYYFRDSNGNEVDLLIEQSKFTHAIEIKSAKTMNDNFLKGLNYYKELSNKKTRTTCIFGGDERYSYKGHHVIGWKNLEDIVVK
ncbi:MAG: ATP-binding protein [Chitinophagaceae bacterium]|nr:ATP-binding protein [Chitinophagaceae bacterium]